MNSVGVRLKEFAEYKDEVQPCPLHLDGDIFRVWEEKRYVLNGVESHVISRRVTGYECAECGKRLESKP